jgi:hypothetical protein
MNNRTSSICLLNNTGMDVFVWQIGAFLFPILGLPGHLIIIITILNSNRRRFQPTSLYFVSISITESIFLLFMFWDWLDMVNLAPDPRKILNCAFFYPFVSSTGFISLILLIQLNLDRILIINKPQQTYLYITYKRILIKILLTFSTLILFIFHFYFSLYYDSKSFIIFGQSCRVYKYAHIWFYSIWPYIQIFSRLIPCLILIYCTIYIFYNRYSDLRKTFLHRQQQISSLVLVLLSIYTFIAIIPITSLQIFNQCMWKYELEYICSNNRAQQWKLLNVICIMCEASIFMIKFYIKFIFSSEFRYDVKQLIICRSKTQQSFI